MADPLELLHAVADATAAGHRLDGPMGLMRAGLAGATPLSEPAGPPMRWPVVEEHLETALAAAPESPARAVIAAVADRLSWGLPYPEHVGDPDMDAMRDNYAYAPIIGESLIGDPDEPPLSALYASDDVFVGVVLQGPHCVYPPHVHKATEVYWPVGGTADWQLGDEWSVHGPGEVIHHVTGARHATVTGDEPALLLFAWVTDPASIPVIIRV